MAKSNSISATDHFESKMLETALQLQQSFYEICSDWHLYKEDEYAYLKDFIGYAMFGPPPFKEHELMYNDKRTQCFNHYVYDDSKQDVINLVFEKVTEYGITEHSNGVICGVIYNVIFDKKNLSKDIGMEPQVFPVPVFKVRVYENKFNENKESKGSERMGKMAQIIQKTYYIDNFGRVYNIFGDYITTNTLPVCTMVLPKDGKYQANSVHCSDTSFTLQSMDTVRTTVWIEVHESPASFTAARVLKGGDAASMVLSVASVGISLASMVSPINPVLALGGAVGAGVSGLWTTGRSAQQLADRGQHGESINIMDKKALGAWLGIAGCMMGLAAMGGTVLLTRAVRTGVTVGKVTKVAYNTVQIGNMIVNGVGIGFKSHDIYKSYTEGSGVSAEDAFFLSAHVFFFCNCIINTRLAKHLIESTQSQFLKDYKTSLRYNRHRKEFQSIVRNTRAMGNSYVSSNEEIIRAINMIDNRDQFFQSMVRNREAFSAASANVSFSSNGNVKINGIMTIDPIELARLPKDMKVDIVKILSKIQSSNTPSVKHLKAATGNIRMPYQEFAAKTTPSAMLSEPATRNNHVPHVDLTAQSTPSVNLSEPAAVNNRVPHQDFTAKTTLSAMLSEPATRNNHVPHVDLTAQSTPSVNLSEPAAVNNRVPHQDFTAKTTPSAMLSEPATRNNHVPHVDLTAQSTAPVNLSEPATVNNRVPDQDFTTFLENFRNKMNQLYLDLTANTTPSATSNNQMSYVETIATNSVELPNYCLKHSMTILETLLHLLNRIFQTLLRLCLPFL